MPWYKEFIGKTKEKDMFIALTPPSSETLPETGDMALLKLLGKLHVETTTNEEVSVFLCKTRQVNTNQFFHYWG